MAFSKMMAQHATEAKRQEGHDRLHDRIGLHDHAVDREVVSGGSNDLLHGDTLYFVSWTLVSDLTVMPGEAVVERAFGGLALHHVIDQQAADAVAGEPVEIEQFDGPLLRLERREVDGEAAPDDAVLLEQHEIELHRLELRRAVVLNDDVGAASVALRLELVELHRRRGRFGAALAATKASERREGRAARGAAAYAARAESQSRASLEPASILRRRASQNVPGRSIFVEKRFFIT